MLSIWELVTLSMHEAAPGARRQCTWSSREWTSRKGGREGCGWGVVLAKRSLTFQSLLDVGHCSRPTDHRAHKGTQKPCPQGASCQVWSICQWGKYKLERGQRGQGGSAWCFKVINDTADWKHYRGHECPFLYQALHQQLGIRPKGAMLLTSKMYWIKKQHTNNVIHSLSVSWGSIRFQVKEYKRKKGGRQHLLEEPQVQGTNE